MNKLTLPIASNKQYIRRDGVVVTPKQVAHTDYRHNVVLVGGESEKPFNRQHYVYINTGLVNYFQLNPLDLVADYPIEKETPKLFKENNLHHFADIFRAIADGKELEWYSVNGQWHHQDNHTTLYEIVNNEYPPERYRVKPCVININGIEVQEPCREALTPGCTYWYVDNNSDEWVTESGWYDDLFDYRRLDKGIIHLSEEAAIQHAKALMSFTTVKT